VRLPSYDRWLLLGGPVFGAGVLAVVGWYIYVKQDTSKPSFWSWLGIVSVVCIAAGSAFLIFGFFMKESKMSSDSEQSKPAEGSSPARERIGYRLSGRSKSKIRNAHIRNQDVAFDVSDDATLEDKDTVIE
jgi:hypothetical protein